MSHWIGKTCLLSDTGVIRECQRFTEQSLKCKIFCLQCMEHGRISRIGTYTLYTAPGWSDLHFLRFSKMDTLRSIGYIFMSSKPQKSANFATCARGKVVSFKKSQGTWKMNIFCCCENLPFSSKNNCQNKIQN